MPSLLRGGFAFARPEGEDSAQTFLASWRDFMGPKMRTVCGVMTSPVLYGGAPGKSPNVSVACVPMMRLPPGRLPSKHRPGRFPGRLQ